MADAIKAVIDASVVMSWLIPDELSNEAGKKLLDEISEEKYALIAPNLLMYEVVNTLKVAIQRNRIDRTLSLQALELFCGLEIQYIDLSEDIVEILAIATEHDLSGYDASYVWLAKVQSCSLFTFDKKLREKTQHLIDISPKL